MSVQTKLKIHYSIELLCMILPLILFFHVLTISCGFFTQSRRFYYPKSKSCQNTLYVCVAFCFMAARENIFKMFATVILVVEVLSF